MKSYMPLYTNHEEPNENTSKCTKYRKTAKMDQHIINTNSCICMDIVCIDSRHRLITYV